MTVLPFAAAVPEPRFFSWVVECCALLGWRREEGERLFPGADPSWFFCYDDGMSPEEAVAEAVRKGVVVVREGGRKA